MVNKRLQFAVDFANASARMNLPPSELAELCRLAQRAFKAGETYCSIPDRGPQRDIACRKLEAKAAEHGFVVVWPGLWPRLVRDDKEFLIP